MLLDLNKLHGPREHVERTMPPSAFDPQDPDYRVAAPVQIAIDVERAGDGAFTVRGTIRTTLELACSRCLDPFEVPVDASFELRYLPQTLNAGVGEREIAADDLGTAYYRDGVLDLVELLREQFQLALPMKPLCSEACRGMCPHCGTNLNRTECACGPQWDDPRLAALKSLLSNQKEK
jgi:uncharacterized protein